jgi:hypothetical protein
VNLSLSYLDFRSLSLAFVYTYREFEGRRPGRRITSPFEIGGADPVPGN